MGEGRYARFAVGDAVEGFVCGNVKGAQREQNTRQPGQVMSGTELPLASA